MLKVKPKKQIKTNQIRMSFDGIRKKPLIQRVLASTKNFNAFFKLNGKIIGEQRQKLSVDFVEFVSENKRQALAEGTLTLDAEMDPFKRTSPFFSLLRGRRYASLTYRLTPIARKKLYLQKGIGTKVLQSLEQMARGQGIQILYGVVRSDNIASQKAMKKQGYQKVKNSNFWFKKIM